MKDRSTPTLPLPVIDAKKSKEPNVHRPTVRTVTFLKQFARNYQVEPLMPEGLQEMMLS